jgi:hypothetical protein
VIVTLELQVVVTRMKNKFLCLALDHTLKLGVFKLIREIKVRRQQNPRLRRITQEEMDAKVKHCKGNVYRNREDAEKTIDQLSDAYFTRMFRMNRESFDELLAKVSSHLQKKQETYAVRNVKGKKGSTVSPRIMLYATLRFLAGGSYTDICIVFRIALLS